MTNEELNELLKKIKDHENRLLKIESLIEKKSNPSQILVENDPMPEDVRSLIGANIDQIKTPLLVAVVLKFYGNLTREQQIQILQKLGKKEAKNLRSGNYVRDVVDKGLAHRLGKSGKDSLFTVTEKGKNEADRVIRELKNNQDKK